MQALILSLVQQQACLEAKNVAQDSAAVSVSRGLVGYTSFSIGVTGRFSTRAEIGPGVARAHSLRHSGDAMLPLGGVQGLNTADHMRRAIVDIGPASAPASRYTLPTHIAISSSDLVQHSPFIDGRYCTRFEIPHYPR